MEFRKPRLIIFICIVMFAAGTHARIQHESPASLANSSAHFESGCTVSFSINAFIPGRLGVTIPGDPGKWFPIVPASTAPFPTFRGVFGNTDGRGFGGGSSKMEVSFNAPVSQIGSLDSGILNFKVGRSIVLGKYNCLFKTCTQTFSNGLGIEQKKIFSVTNPSSTESHISFQYAVENGGGFSGLSPQDIVALVLGGVSGLAIPEEKKEVINPNIDMDITIILKKKESGSIVTTTVDMTGKTDSFPDYEAFVNGKSIYQRETTATSAITGIRHLYSVTGLGVDIGHRTRQLLCRNGPSAPPTTTPPPTAPNTVTQPTTSECSYKPTIGIGSGLADVVRNLQTLLNRKGGYGLVVDGDFGPATDAAVRDWQTRNGLVVDGKVGPQTWGSLCGPAAPPVTTEPSVTAFF